MSTDNNHDSRHDDDDSIDEPPIAQGSPTVLIERGRASESVNLRVHVKDGKALAGTTRPGAVHIYPSGGSENNISAAGRFAHDELTTEDQLQNIERQRSCIRAMGSHPNNNRQLSGGSELWVDTAAGWSVEGISVPTRPSLAHANQSFHSYMDESVVRPPPTVSSLSSRSFFSRHRRLMQEEAIRQRGDEIARQYATNINSGGQRNANPVNFQDGAYVTVATPVPLGEEHIVPNNGDRNKKRVVGDWRVLFLLLLIAIGTIAGMAVKLFLNSKEGAKTNSAGLNTNYFPNEHDANEDGALIVPMPHFSMEMVAIDGSIDQELLLSVTVSHLSVFMEDEIESFEGLKLNITVKQNRSNIISGVYAAAPRVKGKGGSIHASFGGIIKLRNRPRAPDQMDIRAIAAGAFSEPDLKRFVAALEDVGIACVYLVVSDKSGGVIGSLEQGDSGTQAPTGSIIVTDPTPSPTARDDTEDLLLPAASTESIPPTEAPPQMLPTKPLVYPVAFPTDLPTPEAIQLLTPVPTRAPFFTPSKSPTYEPTLAPSKSPTDEPTLAPTSQALNEPTSSPIKTSTAEPTSTPSARPTMTPSISPTRWQPISFKIESQPGFLTTTMENKFSRSGAMFDIKAKAKAIKITSIDLHIENVETDVPVEVWIKWTTYLGFEKYSRVWTQVNNERPYIIPKGYGSGRLTSIPEETFEPIRVAAGSSLGIYVTLQSKKGMLFGNGDYVSEDEYLRIECGASVGFPFDSPMNRDRAFSGAIRYAIE